MDCLLDACEYFITTSGFSSYIKSLPTAHQSLTSDVVAFCLRLAGHFAGTLGPMPLSNQQYADAVDILFDEAVKAETLWSRASVRAAWLTGLAHALADGHPNNRSWLSARGKH